MVLWRLSNKKAEMSSMETVCSASVRITSWLFRTETWAGFSIIRLRNAIFASLSAERLPGLSLHRVEFSEDVHSVLFKGLQCLYPHTVNFVAVIVVSAGDRGTCNTCTHEIQHLTLRLIALREVAVLLSLRKFQQFLVCDLDQIIWIETEDKILVPHLFPLVSSGFSVSAT